MLPKALRKVVGGKARWTCQECGCEKDWRNGWMLHFHHIKPRSEGGKDTASNLELLCVDHHKQRHVDLSSFWRSKGNVKRANQNAGAARLLDGQDRRQRKWKG